MPAQYSFYLIRRGGLPLALAGLILMTAAPWLGVPAAAQFRIGRGGFGMGLMSPPVQQYAPPPPSDNVAEHKSNKVKHAQRASAANERHAKAARTKARAKSDSNSSGAF
jgi:hypothetical protein